MSNLFSGNPPSSGGDKDERQNPRQAAPRAPLFPPRTDPKDGARQTSFARPNAPSPAVGAPAAPAPGSRTESSRPAAPGAPRAPLFPPRDDKAPLFPRAEAPKAPLFPRRDPVPAAPAAGQPRPPLFPSRPAAPAPEAGKAGGASGLFASRSEAPKAPLFPRRDPAPAPGALFPRPASAFSAPAGGGGSPFAPAGARRDAKVTNEEFVLLRDFLYQQSGIYIAENRKYLVENRLASRLRELGLHSFGDYYNYLRYDAGRAAEMNKLFESMTTNETSFFRNGPQLDVFRDKVLARVLDELRSKGQRKLRIWSAGCSSGEEPYTLAIILYEVLKQDIGNWDIKITANDLSPAMLAAARRGLYNDYAIRTTPADMLARYFTREGSLYRIDPKLQKLVAFSQINLSDKLQLQKVERSHIVFCRNVIIYFDDEMKKSVINAFYDNLLPGGYLLIGHSESLHNISRAFKPEHHSGSIVYCKQS